MGEEKSGFERLLALMPEGWEAKAKELGALKRAREIKTPEDLLRLIFLYLTSGRSFAGTSAIIQIAEEYKLNKIAVWKRIKNSAEWLEWLCKTILRQAGLLAEKPAWLAGKVVSLVDASEVVLHGNHKKYYLLHYCLDLFTLAMRELKITDMKNGEKLRNFERFEKGTIVLGDRAYGTIPGMEYLRERGTDYVLRLRSGAFTLYDRHGAKRELLPWLSVLAEGESMSRDVCYKTEEGYIPFRVCAIRKDAESEQAGLKRLKKENQRKRGGKAVSEAQSEYNKYIIVVTSLGEAEATAVQILELYRMRWQIELAFKRLKSLFQYNDIPVSLDQSARAWFYGKLLLAALCETLVNNGRFSPCEQEC
ncbi:putative transposase InsL for insertion sequence element IS186A [Spirochaetia bacterium]|nr:putative transposase InsL for insertion sequence element IS186A [Spirochaetia bacterium]